MSILRMILAFLRAFLASRANLAAENVMLRQQLIVVHRFVPRPKLRPMDRVLLCWLSRLWSNWRSALLIVQSETIVRWHRQGFRLYWRWKSRKKQGRPLVDREIRDLIRRMCQENPTWGAPRILSELLLLGYDVAESTVDKLPAFAFRGRMGFSAGTTVDSFILRQMRFIADERTAGHQGGFR